MTAFGRQNAPVERFEYRTPPSKGERTEALKA